MRYLANRHTHKQIIVYCLQVINKKCLVNSEQSMLDHEVVSPKQIKLQFINVKKLKLQIYVTWLLSHETVLKK